MLNVFKIMDETYRKNRFWEIYRYCTARVPTEGKWFFIDRYIIEKNWSYICNELAKSHYKVEYYRNRFENSIRIANENPKFYTRYMLTYIFDIFRPSITGQKLLNMCKDKGDGQIDEVIADLELMMRICNGESVDDLVYKIDKMYQVRVISLRNGGTGLLGGGGLSMILKPPANITRTDFALDHVYSKVTTSAFLRT